MKLANGWNKLLEEAIDLGSVRKFKGRPENELLYLFGEDGV